MFHRISPENQLRILNMRKKDLEFVCADLHNRQSTYIEGFFRDEVLRLSIEQVRGELEWINELILKVENQE
ncbi:hypothetical protein D3C78_1389310 [compost metagenome]